jgi:hypothetical protein
VVCGAVGAAAAAMIAIGNARNRNRKAPDDLSPDGAGFLPGPVMISAGHHTNT